MRAWRLVSSVIFIIVGGGLYLVAVVVFDKGRRWDGRDEVASNPIHVVCFEAG